MLRNLFMFGFMMTTTLHNHLRQAMKRAYAPRQKHDGLAVKAAVGILMAHRALAAAKKDLAYYHSMRM